MNLNAKQKQRILDSYDLAVKEIKKFSPEEHIELLVSEGIDRKEADTLLRNELKEIIKSKAEAATKKVEEDELESILTYVSYVGATLIGLIKPIFGVQSNIWFITSIILGAILGFFCYRKTPISGVLATVCFVVVVGITHDWYMDMLYESGRTSYRKIEMLIPLIAAGIPSYVLMLLSNKIFYSNKD